QSMMMNDYFDKYITRLVPSFLLPSNVKKEYLTSPGDMLSSDSLGEIHLGWRVAGDTGIGLSLWGYFYYVICFITMFILYYFLASTVNYKDGLLYLPLPILSGLMPYFSYYGNAIGILSTFTRLARSGWTEIIIYCIVFFIIRKIFTK
ncbi:MAG: hypothetical protein LUC91_10260, partial [Prevotella sp.]|nr:hypothetical protein [Prevotella sp.]